jgi:hypothetical protein
MSGLISYKHDPFAEINDYYKSDVIGEAIKSPVIIHFLSDFYNRPWDVNCTHPLKHKYLYYKSMSYWKDLPLRNEPLSLRLRCINMLYKIFPAVLLNFLRYLLNKL